LWHADPRRLNCRHNPIFIKGGGPKAHAVYCNRLWHEQITIGASRHLPRELPARPVRAALLLESGRWASASASETTKAKGREKLEKT
jgi:hypothetical protein